MSVQVAMPNVTPESTLLDLVGSWRDLRHDTVYKVTLNERSAWTAASCTVWSSIKHGGHQLPPKRIEVKQDGRILWDGNKYELRKESAQQLSWLSLGGKQDYRWCLVTAEKDAPSSAPTLAIGERFFIVPGVAFATPP